MSKHKKKQFKEEFFYDDPSDYKKFDNRKQNHNHSQERREKLNARNKGQD